MNIHFFPSKPRTAVSSREDPSLVPVVSKDKQGDHAVGDQDLHDALNAAENMENLSGNR